MPKRAHPPPLASLRDDYVEPDDIPTALRWVRGTYDPSTELRPIKDPKLGKFGEIALFSVYEKRQLEALRDLVRGYVAQDKHPRPLCLAVFGPPGSGKSFSVKQICDAARDGLEAGVLEKPQTMNLTQVPDAEALARALAGIAERQEANVRLDHDRKNVPVVFFDEFDAPRGGAPFGWLGWFLAPMHDGEFLHAGRIVTLKRAIYVFAGGTASTMAAFSEPRDHDAFRAAKGPDFVSRLRGFLDVRGPNAEPCALRRAVILRRELHERVKAIGDVKLTPAPDLLQAFLRAGRYVHGARSIGAVLEMSGVQPRSRAFGFKQLPDDHLLAQHVDLGPLDPAAIDGAIALSGYGDDARATERLRRTWLAVTNALWKEGATLVYGGAWGKILTDALDAEHARMPRVLRRGAKAPSPRLLTFKSAKTPRGNLEPPEPTREERAFLHKHGGDDCAWVVDAVKRFRKRLQISELSVARFAIAGKVKGHNGRFSGIAEEVMLTLALGKPVYVAGGFGGAARDVGALLGLERPWEGRRLRTFDDVLDERRKELLADYAEKMRPPPFADPAGPHARRRVQLPMTQDQLVSFLRQHALGGPGWPDNGLSQDDNRKLFRSTNAQEVAELVTRGLLALFGRV